MSWSIRDHRQGRTEGQDVAPLPPSVQHFKDSEPLPTYCDGLEAYDADTASDFPLWQRRAMHEQGLWTKRELDRFSCLVRRGITEL